MSLRYESGRGDRDGHGWTILDCSEGRCREDVPHHEARMLADLLVEFDRRAELISPDGQSEVVE